MKGIILAGGYGTRLYPITRIISKQLLPVYDKPMIYYPLSVLMLSGIREILIISTPYDIENFKKLLGDGKNIGMKFSYAIQDKPRGLADAFIVGEKFIGDDNVALILGDNIFYGHGLSGLLKSSFVLIEKGEDEFGKRIEGIVFGYYVKDPERYGVVEFDDKGNVISIEEKPDNPKSNYAVTGLYFYNNEVVEIAKTIKPSARGELEITDVNKEFLRRGSLKVELLGRGYSWLDTGTHSSLMDAGNFIRVIEERQGLKIGCIEEIAYKNGWISEKQLKDIAEPLLKSGYGKYLLRLVE